MCIRDRSYSTFRSKDVTPLAKNITGSQENLHILELFHGPTYAFKDVALQFVGNLFEYFLQRLNKDLPQEQRKKITVVGATSGDTGSAAIYGLRGKKDVSVFILYPTGRISPIQEEQMTTVPDKNVQTLSVKGTFDNCQDTVKAIFGDKEFNTKHNVGAVNSINWARILAQITYYFYAYFQAGNGKKEKVKFVVPSGNFGDILAGYYAKKMGLPVEKLVIATNENDILDRFLKSGTYERSDDVAATLSPAMDILISSNFERLLWYLAREYLAQGDDLKAGEILNGWFQELKTKGKFEVDQSVIQGALKDFDSEKVSNSETTATIKDIYERSQNPSHYILDPHTAVGVCATERQIKKDNDSSIPVSYTHLDVYKRQAMAPGNAEETLNKLKFITSIVNKTSMNKCRNDNYFLSLTHTAESDKLPLQYVFMSENNQLNGFIPHYANANFNELLVQCSDFLQFISFTDLPDEKPITDKLWQSTQMPRCVIPVSYTHLDVYKRQVKRMLG